MFLGFAILGGLVSLIAIFSLITAFHQRSSKVGASALLIIALLLTGWSVWKLPYWSHQQAKDNPTTKSRKKISSNSGQAFDSQSHQATRADNEKSVNKQLGKSLQKIGTMSFDAKTKTYTLTVTNKDLQSTIRGLTKHPEQAKQAKWPRFVNSFSKTSASLKKALGTGYTFQIGLKNQKPVLIYKDGYVTYNKFE
ncbi:hypothetical protein [Levilactobacillus humaensis]|uniref:hypothetical protein n=1 Tax=Levilactobacillus humaensis TaxID=2950375 RepID=UPI0021C3DEE5|nr:hypothetical protein [Levilactobacillus humaensis]